MGERLSHFERVFESGTLLITLLLACFHPAVGLLKAEFSSDSATRRRIGLLLLGYLADVLLWYEQPSGQM
jgi:hypothetical protein